jgi:tartrate dehydratase alpha subunit/fumarate hydratase class I-like protein
MAEIRTVTTLRRKRDEISASIRMYEKKVAQARAGLGTGRRGFGGNLTARRLYG